MEKKIRWIAGASISLLLSLLAMAQGTPSAAKPAPAPDPAKQVQAAIAAVQGRLAAMDAMYGSAGVTTTLNAAYKAKGTPPPQDAAAWNDWMAAAWKDVRPFYELKLAALKAELDALQKTGTDQQLGSLQSDLASWQQNEKKIAGLFQQMTGEVAQQAVVLGQAAKNPAQKDALTKQAAQLKTDAEHQRASAMALASGASAAAAGTGKTPAAPKGGKNPSGKPATSAGGQPKDKTPPKTAKPGTDKNAKGKDSSGGKGDKNAKSGGDKGGNAGGDKGGNAAGGEAGPTPVQQTVTVCKCKPSQFPFNVQTTGESIQSSDPDIAEARIQDGHLVITGKKYGKATITVKGDVVKYNVGIPDAPKPGKGGIHGNGPNDVPLNGNYGFAYTITVHVICDLTGPWSGAPVGSVKIVDSCGKVQLASQKAVFSGSAVLGAKSYGKIHLIHTLTLDEVSKSLPDPVRQQVAGRAVTIEGTVGEGENSISGTLIKDKVHWVKQDDGSYSVDFPGTVSENVLITRDNKDSGGSPPPAAGKGPAPGKGKGKGN
ncbi:MAG TPA: hypothetical protein VLT85_01100 [Terriglobales bacterium]|nr:hypothetical protein [Terriglobales bacterium]